MNGEGKKRRGRPPTVPREELEAVIRALIADEVLLAELLVEVAVNGKSEEARVAAGIAVLQRVGLAKGVKVTSEPLLDPEGVAAAVAGRPALVDDARSPGEIVHERLAKLRAEGRLTSERLRSAAPAPVPEGPSRPS